MSSIDSRVVEMQFDNKKFGDGVKDTLSHLDKLKQALKLDGATSGLDDVEKAAGRFSLQGMLDGVTGAAKSFGALQIAGITALVNLTNKAVDAGLRIAKSLTISPVMAGLDSYAEQINATQVIMANTKAAGTTLPQITAALANLQSYAQQTVYSFSDMTSNIGRFTAAGVKLQPATDAIKGMANVAALSGANTQQMSGAMYQMSQALSTGVIKLQDWNSLANANMAGQGIQDALKETARTMGDNGKAMDAAIKKQGNFRNSLTEGWLTADIYTKAMSVFGGTMDESTGKFRAFTVEELKAKGYSEAAAKSLHQLSQDALNSAVNIRTIPQLMDALKEEVAGAWAQVFKTVFGDINQATTLFSSLHTVMENMLTGPVNSLNNVLKGWAKLGGRDALLAAFTNAWKALAGIVGPIKDAFREIFPATSAENLVKMTKAFRNFTARLIPSQKTMDGIKRTFAGLFAVLDIGKQLISAVVRFIVELVGHFSKGSGSILDFTAKIGDWLKSIDDAIKKGDVFNKFFDKLVPKIEKPIDALKRFVSAIFAAGASSKIVDQIKKSFEKLSNVGDKVSSIFDKIKAAVHAVWDAIQPVFKSIAGAVKDFVGSLNFGDVLAGAGVGAFVLLIMKIRSAFSALIDKIKGTGKGPGIFAAVKESLEKLTGTLEQMQKVLKATALLEIAAAIAVLTIAVSVLSKIDAAGLAKATAAITAMLIQLTGTLIVMDKMMKKAKGMKLDMIALAMILVATAIDILASAVKKMSELSWNDLAKGLTGTVVLLGALAATMKRMTTRESMLSNSAGILIMASAIKVLVSAVKDISDMSWAQLAEGLTGVAALLGALGLYTRFSSMSSIGDGAGLLLLAAAIKVLASALKDISDLSWANLAEGLVGVAGALGILVAAIQKLPTKIVFDSAGVLLIAASLKIIASALQDFGSMSWADISAGVVAMAATLAIVVAAMQKLDDPKMLLGAAALVIVSGGLKILASAFADMGGMSWSDIAAAMVALGGSLLILTVGLIAMGDPIILLGAAALLASSFGVKALAGAMVSLGSMSWSDIGAALVALTGGLLALAVGLTAMIVALPGAGALALAAPSLTALAVAMQAMGGMSWADIGAALVALTGGLLSLAVGLTAMIVALPGAGALALAAPALSALAIGMQMTGSMSWSDIAAALVALTGGLLSLAVGLTAMVASLPGALALKVAAPALVIFADAAKKIGAMSWSDIAAAAVGIGKFLSSLAVDGGTSDRIQRLGNALKVAAPAFQAFVPAVKSAGGVGGNVRALAGALSELAKVPPDALTKIASAANTIARALPNLNSAVSKGIAPNASAVIQAGADMANNFAKGITGHTQPATDAGKQLVQKVVAAAKAAIQSAAGQVGGDAQSIGANIVAGVNRGIDYNSGSVSARMRSMAANALAAARQELGIHSPSKKFQEIGHYVVEGFALGLTGRPEKVKSAVDNLVGDLMGKFDDAMQSNLDDISSHKDKISQLKDQIKQNAKDIRAAQQDLNDAINTPITRSKAKSAADRRAADAKAETARANRIRDLQKRVGDLTTKQNSYNKSLNAEQAAINKDTAEYKTLSGARSTLLHQLNDEQAKLNKLTSAHDALNKKIEDQKQVLADATKTRDDFNQSLREQYGQQADITKDTNVGDYIKNLQTQIVHTQQFTTALQQLRKRGLNDELYKMLLAKGPEEGMPFVQQLLDGSQAQLNDLNSLGKSLDKAAGTLGDAASKSLYQAGVDSAAGILKGLQSQASAIQKQMDDIATYMVNALKKKLGIHSPSRVFAELGGHTAEGLIQGLLASSSKVGTAAESIGQSAIDSMKKTISGLGDLVGNDMDLNPVIAPVLDLSDVQKSASKISSLITPAPISVQSSYSSAQDASVGLAAIQAAILEAKTAEPAAPVTFIQNNNSPKALSRAEIYRQTNNQLSVAKGALASNAK